jgi:hypothetical protein
MNGHLRDWAKGTPYVLATLVSIIWLLMQGGVVQSRAPAADPIRLANAFAVLEARDMEGIPMAYWPRRWGGVMSSSNDHLRDIAEILKDILAVEKEQAECLGRIMSGRH